MRCATTAIEAWVLRRLLWAPTAFVLAACDNFDLHIVGITGVATQCDVVTASPAQYHLALRSRKPSLAFSCRFSFLRAQVHANPFRHFLYAFQKFDGQYVEVALLCWCPHTIAHSACGYHFLLHHVVELAVANYHGYLVPANLGNHVAQGLLDSLLLIVANA